jgi:thymidylate kinase
MQGIVPDLTIYLRLDSVTALERVRHRNEQPTVFEQEKHEFWQRVAHGYEEIFATRNNVLTLDGTMSQQALCELAVHEIVRRRE